MRILKAKITALLAMLLDERRPFTHTPPRQTLRPDDQKAIGALLSGISKSIGVGVCFSVHDLIVRSKDDDRLRTALIEAVGSDQGRAAARKAGDLLRRATGLNIFGLRIARVKVTAEGVLWALERCMIRCRHLSPSTLLRKRSMRHLIAEPLKE
jgi:hypothetical protein